MAKPSEFASTAVDLALVRAVSTVIDSTVEEMNGTIEFSVSYLETPNGHADVLARVLGRGENTAVISVILTDQDDTRFGFAKGSYSISKKNHQGL
jgi:acyl-coenzyme A thioesterase PaaI-like protein